MKRLFLCILALCFFLSGCSVSGERMKEPVTFYYLRSEYEYFAQDGVIVSEEREASGHREDLSYLMALYLMGPSGEDLVSPVPRGTRIHVKSQTGDVVELLLSDNPKTMTDTEFSLASACLSLTCFDLTDAQTVIISCGERSQTMIRDSLIQYDNSATVPEEPK